jgi:putative inorganic carbon (hco3(-)) transporter
VGYRAYLLYVFVVFVRPIEQFAPDLMALRPVLILWAVAFLGSVWDAKKRNWGAARKQYVGVMAALSLAAFLSVWANADLEAAMTAFGVISTPVMLFILTCLNIDTLDRFKGLVKVFVLSIVVLCLQGLAAYHKGINVPQLVIPQLASENIIPPKDKPPIPAEDTSGAWIWRLRSIGFLSDPNDFAQTIIVVAPWVFMRFSSGMPAWRQILLASPWLALFGYTLSLTHSRGGMLGAAAALAFFFKDKVGKKVAMLLVAAAVSAFFLGVVGGGERGLSGKEQSASERIDAWNEGIQMLKENPVFGVGFDRFVDHHIRTAHNSFVLCFAEIGLLGYFLWMGLIAIAFTALSRIITGLRPDDEIARCAVLLRISLVGFLVCAWFLSRAFVPTLFILMGMSVALLHAARAVHAPSFAPILHAPVVWRLSAFKAMIFTILLVSAFIRFSR